MTGTLGTLFVPEEIPLTVKSAGISFFVTKLIQITVGVRVSSFFASDFVDIQFVGLPPLLIYRVKPYCVSMNATRSLISSSFSKTL
jgi:hypothetical protein